MRTKQWTAHKSQIEACYVPVRNKSLKPVPLNGGFRLRFIGSIFMKVNLITFVLDLTIFKIITDLVVFHTFFPIQRFFIVVI